MNPFLAGLIGLLIGAILMLLYQWWNRFHYLVIPNNDSNSCLPTEVTVEGEITLTDKEKVRSVKGKVYASDPPADSDDPPEGETSEGTWSTDPTTGKTTYRVTANRTVGSGKVKVWAEIYRYDTGIHDFDCGATGDPSTPIDPASGPSVQP